MSMLKNFLLQLLLFFFLLSQILFHFFLSHLLFNAFLSGVCTHYAYSCGYLEQSTLGWIF